MATTVHLIFCLFLAVVAVGRNSTGHVMLENNSAGYENNKDKTITHLTNADYPHSRSEELRVKRQESNATTNKPIKHRPSNIFNLISVLVTETREDASKAFNEIGTLFNSQFDNSTEATAIATTTTTTTTTTLSSASNETSEEQQEDVVTTTEAFRITRNEFLGVVRSNVQGLFNLFGKEFRVAIKDSNDNVKEFGRGLQKAFKPFFS